MELYEKNLRDLTSEEWEKICMKCGKCCLTKYDINGIVYLTNQVCRFFDKQKCECSRYATRLQDAKGECQKVDIDLIENHFDILPPTCAYRLLFEGKPLPAYHPLLTGNANSVIESGQSIRSWEIVSEQKLYEELDEVHRRAEAEQWSKNRIVQEEYKIRQKYRLRFLFAYPVKKK